MSGGAGVPAAASPQGGPSFSPVDSSAYTNMFMGGQPQAGGSKGGGQPIPSPSMTTFVPPPVNNFTPVSMQASQALIQQHAPKPVVPPPTPAIDTSYNHARDGR